MQRQIPNEAIERLRKHLKMTTETTGKCSKQYEELAIMLGSIPFYASNQLIDELGEDIINFLSVIEMFEDIYKHIKQIKINN